ncbi:hypothetical protein C6N08_02660, partial [Streptococcus agalactiae]
DFVNEVQVINTVLSFDENASAPMAAMFGSSLALSISDIPFNGHNGFAACMNKEEVHDLPPVVISACQTLNLYQETQKLVLELGGKNKNA